MRVILGKVSGKEVVMASCVFMYILPMILGAHYLIYTASPVMQQVVSTVRDSRRTSISNPLKSALNIILSNFAFMRLMFYFFLTFNYAVVGKLAPWGRSVVLLIYYLEVGLVWYWRKRKNRSNIKA